VNLAHGRPFDAGELKMSPDAKPVLLPARSALGEAYLEAMDLAGRYAYAGRDWVVTRVLSILGARSLHEVHNHHNFAWRERHFGTDLWVVRKGCTPAFPGQQGFVGGSMGEDSVILEGVDSEASEAGLRSTVHGAGRVMSRTQAAGRLGPRAECTERDCDVWVTWGRYRDARERASLPEDARFTLCERHPNGRMVKRRGRVKEGRVDFAAVQAGLRAQGVELRGGAADEAPEAYKRLDEVLAAHGSTVEVLHRLTPIGVAMAAARHIRPVQGLGAKRGASPLSTAARPVRHLHDGPATMEVP